MDIEKNLEGYKVIFFILPVYIFEVFYFAYLLIK